MGDRLILIDALRVIACTATADQERAAWGARMWGAAGMLEQEMGLVLPPEEHELVHQMIAPIRSKLGDDTFAAALTAGAALALDVAIAEALIFVPWSGSNRLDEHGERTSQSGLTSRELEVLDLLALRRTDQEIADTLFISRRTVNSHVAHILAKLNATTRRDAVTQALALQRPAISDPHGQHT
jgi:non-specific serine/threonine protein kinase